MDKPKIFIGSSTESIRIAQALQENLEAQPEVECLVWNQDVFELTKNVLDNLIDALKGFDYAIFIYSNEDILKRKGQTFSVARDNVIFETGLSIGLLGRRKTFFIIPKDCKKFRLLSDLSGLVIPEFDQKRFEAGDETAALAVVSRKILKAVRQTYDTTRSWLRDLKAEDIESVFRRTGLTNAYESRNAAYSKMIQDIRAAKRSVSMYARVFLSNLLKGPELVSALTEAATHKTDTRRSKLVVRHVSTFAGDTPLVTQLYLFEDPTKRIWPTLTSYKQHLKASDAYFDEKYNDLRANLANIKLNHRKRVMFERAYMRDYLLPFSLLVVDNVIVYVSFYSLSSKRYGTFAPTMRLIYREGDPEGKWACKFLNEKKNIDKNFLSNLEKKPLI